MDTKTGIALFVYNRPYHTQKVLEGLKDNNISKLYIFSDGSKNVNDNAEVKEVRSLIRNIEWCETEIHIHSQNKGLANSIVEGVNYVLGKYDRIIVLEDDCVPSSDFVSFMEACFDRYENNDKIMSVSGFSLPIRIPENYKYDIYFSYRSCSSGWGTWKRAWDFFDRNKSLLNEIDESKDFKRRVFLAGQDLVPMLERQIKGEDNSWSVFWSLSIIKNKGLCINPVHSRINNIGFDGSGVHSKLTNKFDVSFYKMDSRDLLLPDEEIINNRIIKSYQRLYAIPIKKKFKLELIRISKFIRIYKFLKIIKSKIPGVKNENNSS